MQAERREEGTQSMTSQKLPCHVILIKSSSFLVLWSIISALPETWLLCSEPLPEGIRHLQDSGYTNPTALHPYSHHSSTRSDEEKHLCPFTWTEGTGRLLVGMSVALQQGQASLVLLLFPQCSVWDFSTAASYGSPFLTGF